MWEDFQGNRKVMLTRDSVANDSLIKIRDTFNEYNSGEKKKG